MTLTDRLRVFRQQFENRGLCHIVSLGHECPCPLCLIDACVEAVRPIASRLLDSPEAQTAYRTDPLFHALITAVGETASYDYTDGVKLFGRLVAATFVAERQRRLQADLDRARWEPGPVHTRDEAPPRAAKET